MQFSTSNFSIIPSNFNLKEEFKVVGLSSDRF